MTTVDGRIQRRAPLLLGALALLAYWPVLVGKVPLPADVVTRFPPWESTGDSSRYTPAHAEMGDLVTELYPWRLHTRRAAEAGVFPLWNPHLLLGAPFAGDPQTGLFYPPNLVYAFLPTPVAWSLSFLLRIVLAGTFAALVTRALGATREAALAAGVVFAFCGWVTAFQARPHLDSVLWLSLAFLGIDRLQRAPDGPSVALVAAAFALPVLAGQPESAAHVTLAGVAFFLYRFALPPRDGLPAGRTRFIALFAAAGLLAMGLAAVQMLPALEFIGQLDRGLDASWGPRPLSEIFAFLSRDLGGNPNSAGVPIPEGAAYAGMMTLLVAPLAILHRNRRDAIFFLVLVACALQIVYGWGPAYWLSLRTPVLRGIPNGRLLGVADLGLAVLAGLGLSALAGELDARGRARARWWILSGAALVTAAIGVGTLIVRARPAPHRLLTFATVRGPASSALVLLAAAALLGLTLAGAIPARRAVPLAIAVLALDLVTASARYIPFKKPAEIFPPAPTFRFLGSDPEPHRVASVDHTYGAGFELAYGLDSATGFNVVLRRTERLLAPLGYLTHSPGMTSTGIAGTRNRFLDLMNVKYLVATTSNSGAEALARQPERFRLAFSDWNVRVFENLTVLPRAFLVPASGIRLAADERDELAMLSAPDFDPTRTVVLSGTPPAQPSGREAPAGPARVSGFEQGINTVALRADADVPSVLVLSQAHYPGWKAFLDEREVPVLRVDYGFTGVAVGPGTHRIRFALEPRSLRIGAFLSGAAFVLGVGLCVSKGRPQ